MSAKTINITYWVLTALLALAMAGDGFGGITRQQAAFRSPFFGAIASGAFAGNAASEFIPPVIMLACLFVTYYFWKKYNQLKPTE